MMVMCRRHLPGFLAYLLGFGALGLAWWIRGNFGRPSVEQILYHVYFADTAAARMSGVFLASFLVEVVAVPLVCALLACWVHARVLPHSKHPRIRPLRFLPHMALLAGISVLLAQVPVASYAAAFFQPDRFAQAYVEPTHVQLGDAPRRNLVLIYVESLEATYGDATLFGADLLAPLHALGGSRLPAYRQAPGQGWTMAGIVATQCGVPLIVNSPYDIERTPGTRVYLPGATCLGDVLARLGYYNVFMGGASLAFAGKGAFLRDHGYHEVHGREEWLRQGASFGQLNFWGLTDEALFERARHRVDALHAAGAPFNLTLLTVDTHGPDGFPSPSCARMGPTDFQAIVACTARQVADFVQHMERRGYLRDTTVVIIGDHLAAGIPLDAQLARSQDRRVFNLFLGEALPALRAREMLPFDMFPTLLEAVGVPVAGQRLALGRSGFAADEAVPMIHWGELEARSVAMSDAYARLWRSTR